MLTKINRPVKINNFGMIPVSPGSAAIVDIDDYENIKKYRWHLIKQHGRGYAARKVKTNGKIYWVRMHRQIMHTPNKFVVHHRNRRTLDNRRSNLVNVTDARHTEIHKDPFLELA